MKHHLAQVNIARLLAPLDSPRLADFVAWLEPVNAMSVWEFTLRMILPPLSE